MLSANSLEAALEALGAVLDDRELTFEVVCVGGGSLLLLDLIERPTRDLDLMARVEANEYVSAEPLPRELQAAIRDVAQLLGLPTDWVNGGPTMQLSKGLPPGFERRVHRRSFGGLHLQIASRTDQIALKLYAAADSGPQSKHVADLRRLRPTTAELADAAAWVKTQDVGVEFGTFVDQVVAFVRNGDDG